MSSYLGKFIKMGQSYSRRRQCQPTPVLLPGKSDGQRSLVGYSPWGRKKLDTTEWLHFHFSLSFSKLTLDFIIPLYLKRYFDEVQCKFGEGNGNPIRCSCLENPRDREARWAAVYGVAQSRTRLKRLGSRVIHGTGWHRGLWIFNQIAFWELHVSISSSQTGFGSRSIE